MPQSATRSLKGEADLLIQYAPHRKLSRVRKELSVEDELWKLTKASNSSEWVQVLVQWHRTCFSMFETDPDHKMLCRVL